MLVKVRHLLETYQCESYESSPTQQFIESMCEVSVYGCLSLRNAYAFTTQMQRHVDEAQISDEQVVALDLPNDYPHAFILPMDSFECEHLRGLPKDLEQYVERLVAQGATIKHNHLTCHYNSHHSGAARRVLHQPGASGSWRVHFGRTYLSVCHFTRHFISWVEIASRWGATCSATSKHNGQLSISQAPLR